MMLGALSAQSASAAVTLNGTATFNVGTSLYDYEYSVNNTEANDLVLVSVPALSGASILGLQAPAGFAITYDPSQGWVNLNEDNDILTNGTFAPNSTTGPFRFSSPVVPQLAGYQVFDSLGNEFSGSVLAPVPEPGTSLLTVGVGLLGFILRRRKTS